MHITGLTVCVDYADYLALSLPIWRSTLDELLVVTAPRDQATQELCESLGVRMHLTNVFWDHGAAFNKGAAIAEAAETLDYPDWLLLFDADVCPPDHWRDVVAGREPGKLYGCKRVSENGRRIADPSIAGFFFLAHKSDPRMQRKPLVESHWNHAGNYDTEFMIRWGLHQRVMLPLTLKHFGEVWTNWFGRGRKDEMQKMHRERRRRGNRYGHERINPETTHDPNAERTI